MLFRRSFLALMTCFAVLPATLAAAEVDRSDPVATAQAFLTAYKARDLAVMAELVNQTNKRDFTELAEQGESHGMYKGVFSGWRWEAATSAPDTVGEVRYRRDEAVVFLTDMPGDEVAVLVLTSDAGVWGIEDINSPSPADFAALPTTPQ